MTLRLATRGSPLARWQAEHVAGLLGASGSDVELVIVETTGDRRVDVPIHEIGGQGVFVKEVQAAVLDGRAELAVHSAKDLPSLQAPGLVIGAVPERGDVRDALAGAALDDLPAGSVIATGSVRRRAQLANRRPDLTFTELRGNIATRLAKIGEVDAIVVAYAALIRLGRAEVASQVLPTDLMLPQVAQGALAVECRADDQATLRALAGVEHGPSRRAVDAERSFLAQLGGGCDLPVGALAAADGSTVELTVLIATPDGRSVLRAQASGSDPEATGKEAARALLDDAGGRLLLGD